MFVFVGVLTNICLCDSSESYGIPAMTRRDPPNGPRQPKLRCCWAPPVKGLIKFHGFGATMIDKTSIGLANKQHVLPKQPNNSVFFAAKKKHK